PADPAQDRFDQLDDIVATTSEVFLGLTVGCARCHDHKFEPITQHDYYRMIAVVDPLRRPQEGRTERDLPIGTRDQVEARARRTRKIEELHKEVASPRAASRSSYLRLGRSRLPSEAIDALAIEPAKRTDAQKALAEKHEKALDAELTAA